MSVDQTIAPKKRLNPLVKLAIEIGPLTVFFVVNGQAGIYWATGTFMAAITIALSLNYLLLRRVPVMLVVTGAFVLVFGGLTLFLHNDLFIKLKPTIVNGLFATILFVGLAFGKLFLKNLGEAVFELTDEGWRILTIRWGLYFVVLALLNEFVWRNFSTDAWVGFKFYGIMPLTILFSIAQMPTPVPADRAMMLASASGWRLRKAVISRPRALPPPRAMKRRV